MEPINTDLAIKYLVEELNLKNEAELAEKLKMNKNMIYEGWNTLMLVIYSSKYKTYFMKESTMIVENIFLRM